MKKLFTLTSIVLVLLVTSCGYDDSGILSRLDALETENKSNIATLQQQIDAINATLPELKHMDAELKEYIINLHSTASSLEVKIEETNTDIAELEKALDEAISDAEASDDALKVELVSQLNTAKADVLAQLQSTKTALEAELALINSTIATLETKDAEVEQKITTLEEYVNSELKNTEDWVSATFATLEQYNSVCDEIATIKQNIEAITTSITELEERLNTKIANDIATAVSTLDEAIQTKVTEITTAYTTAISSAKEEIAAAYTEAIAAAIANLESSVKEWVNEQLAGYYTIAEVDAELELLEKTVADGDATLLDEINKLSERIDTMKTTITEAYQSAITTAITENNGVIDTKIANEIATVNSRIDSEVATINCRIDTLEGRIEALEDIINKIQALDIVFDHTDNLVCYPGASVEVGYTIVGGDAETAIECFGDGGWSASIVKESVTAGKIKVTAPKDATSGKVVVLATSGVGGSTMKSLYFDEGILTDILDTYEVDWEACTLNVTLKTNLAYTINIPTDTNWVSIANTRAEVREDVLTFSIAENLVSESRSVTIMLVDDFSNVIDSFIIIQEPQPAIEFADQFVKQVCVNKFDTNGDGELSYKEASKVTSLGEYFFGDYATAVKSFDELQYFVGLKNISDSAFTDCGNLVSVIIPDGVIVIGYYTFANCHKLIDVTIPNSVTTIGEGAFWGCMDLVNLTLPDSTIYIGEHAFDGCSSLTKINIPYGITEIKSGTFCFCENLVSVTIPDSVVKIGDYAFKNCRSLDSVIIPDSVTIIKSEAFSHCENLTRVIISKSISIIDEYAFYWCGNLTTVYCMATSVPYLGEMAFYGHPFNRKIYVPNESINLYKTTDGWIDYADYIFQCYTEWEWASVVKNWHENKELLFTATSADGSLKAVFDFYDYDDTKALAEGAYPVSAYYDGIGMHLRASSYFTYNNVESQLAEGTATVEHIAGGYKITYNVIDKLGRQFTGVIEGPIEGATNPA